MDGDTQPALQTRTVRVHGRVQGVGYRWSCIQQARVLGITGWVRNRLDGSVEAMLQGPPAQLARMCDWMRADVPGARVDRIEVDAPAPPAPRFDRFEQHATA